MQREVIEIIAILIIFGIILVGVAAVVPFIQHDEVCKNCSVNYTKPNEAMEDNNT